MKNENLGIIITGFIGIIGIMACGLILACHKSKPLPIPENKRFEIIYVEAVKPIPPLTFPCLVKIMRDKMTGQEYLIYFQGGSVAMLELKPWPDTIMTIPTHLLKFKFNKKEE